MLRKISILVVLFAAACTCPQAAVDQARDNVSINQSHVEDEALPREARLIAQDNADAWEAQLYVLENGEEPSEGARERSGGE